MATGGVPFRITISRIVPKGRPWTGRRRAVEWYPPRRFREMADGAGQRLRRDALLPSAEAICITSPFPTRLVARAPRVRFVHQLPADVSVLMRGDLWRSGVPARASTLGRMAGSSRHPRGEDSRMAGA